VGVALVSLLDEGVAAVRRGALDEAFALFERDCGASRHRPSYYWWFLADHVLGREERVEAMLRALDRLLASTREPAERREASWKQGKLLERLGRAAEAERAFARAAAPATERPHERQAAAEEPPPADGEADDRARTWHHRGAALLAAGHPQEALACFERSLADNSGEWASVDVMRVAELDRARALAALGRHAEALTILGRMAAVDEREPLSSARDCRLALVYHAQAASEAALGGPATETLRRFVATAAGVARRFPGMLASEIAAARRQLDRA
jgi:tetratricopeptide (TPR) repeat protein